MQPLPGDRLQHLHIFSAVSRPDVLDLARPLPRGVHDLHRDRVAGRRHCPDIGRTDRLKIRHLVHTWPIETLTKATFNRAVSKLIKVGTDRVPVN
jgi:hypothetical protein